MTNTTALFVANVIPARGERSAGGRWHDGPAPLPARIGVLTAVAAALTLAGAAGAAAGPGAADMTRPGGAAGAFTVGQAIPVEHAAPGPARAGPKMPPALGPDSGGVGVGVGGGGGGTAVGSASASAAHGGGGATTTPGAAGDPARGARVFGGQCAMCHAVQAGASHEVGPHLAGILGRPVAGADGFDGYSPGLQAMGAAGQVWDAALLDEFLRAPYRLAPDTRMGFGGLQDRSERDSVIAFLAAAAAGAAPDLPAGPEMSDALLAIEGDPEWGAFLAAECAACHRSDGGDDGIPSITGWPEAGFAAVLNAYRTGQRPNPTMQVIAGRLSDDEIAALAAHFAQLPPAR